jgi:hypothetical protein
MAHALPDPLLHDFEGTQRNFEALMRAPVWNAPVFAAGWAAWGGYAAGFAVDALGWVHLRGLVAKPSAVPANFETIFTLPEGLRPELQMNAATLCVDLTCGITVAPSGAVGVRVVPGGIANNSWLSLDIPPFYGFQ